MKRALVVDDLQENTTLLTFELEDDGFDVQAVHSGRDCLDTVQTTPLPDIILLDIHMPGLSGLDVLRQLKAEPKTADIPVIMVSANDSDSNIVEAIDLGAHDFVSKPIEYTVLAARVRSALRLSTTLLELEQANLELNKLATVDPLTACYNRRHFFTLAKSEADKAKRHTRPLAAMMIDIDHFKTINDKFGHAAGDYALQQFRHSCMSVCRSSDIIGRLGGEEFALCCPDANAQGVLSLAERIRNNCENLPIQFEQHRFSMTLSIGVTELAHGENFDEALHRADKAMYNAKQAGRNQTSMIHAPDNPSPAET